MVQLAPRYMSTGELILNGKVNISNVACVSKARLGDPICNLNKDEIENINNALIRQFDLSDLCFEYKNKYTKSKKYIDKINKESNDMKNKLQDILNLVMSEQENEMLIKIKQILDK